MTDLETRLAGLAHVLKVNDAGIVDSIMARVDRSSPSGEQPAHRRLQMVAVFLLILAVAIALIPESRSVVARWFGLDHLRIERDADLELPPTPLTFDLPGPGESRIVKLNGREIMVSAIDGQLGGPMMRKRLGSSTSIIEVDVAGNVGLWIDGAPHEVMYETSDGSVAVERVAGNTLIWEVGEVLYRLEGFDDLADAIEFAGTRIRSVVSD